MSDLKEILPEDSVSQIRSFSTSLSSHFPRSVNELTVPPGIIVIDRCKVVVNTPDSLNKLASHFNKVSFSQAIN